METIVGIVIITMIFAVLLPLTFQLFDGVNNRQQAMHAMTSNYEALALSIQVPEQRAGMFIISGQRYHWAINQQQVCTSYENKIGVQKKCVIFKK
ncbi:hypothetical protein [Kurthia sibirica]|uniref:Competence protein ComG n=1 Tax=Kurthia sibirica TaxID=202750 RepID=A0A2U3ALV5_9BACL|nr:hypothetical protein [Kurthia sibirica]PWI25533.1 hypothetical protein DEX24_07960 [Kurthia sibirica]GEK33909.1 hypothetical protein KSI01_14420 [Kurthia sibirica]